METPLKGTALRTERSSIPREEFTVADEKEERSAEELAGIDRASRAGEDDAKAGKYDPDDKLSSDTDDQKNAYGASHQKASK